METSKTECKAALEALDTTTVNSAYSGKAGKCCCGCSGTYRYVRAAGLPSYLTEEDVGGFRPNAGRNMVRKMLRLFDKGEVVRTFCWDKGLSVDTRTRTYTVYFG